MVDTTRFEDELTGNRIRRGGRLIPVSAVENTAQWESMYADQVPAALRRIKYYGDSTTPLFELQAPDTLMFSMNPRVEEARRDESSVFVRRIHGDLEDDIQDAGAELSISETECARRTCLRFARKIAPHIALGPDLKFAGFVEEDGVVSLGIQCLTADRRINLEIQGRSLSAEVHSIDEHMHSEHFHLHVDDTQSIRELAEWVRERV